MNDNSWKWSWKWSRDYIENRNAPCSFVLHEANAARPTRASSSTSLWTLDKHLDALAARLGVAWH